MRIITAKEFLEIEKPVLFQIYKENGYFDWGRLCLKCENCLPDDFFYIELMGEWVQTKDCKPKKDGEFYDLLYRLEKSGGNFERDYETKERDGHCDMERRYVVYDENDIKQLIQVLQSVIKQ